MPANDITRLLKQHATALESLRKEYEQNPNEKKREAFLKSIITDCNNFRTIANLIVIQQESEVSALIHTINGVISSLLAVRFYRVAPLFATRLKESHFAKIKWPKIGPDKEHVFGISFWASPDSGLQMNRVLANYINALMLIINQLDKQQKEQEAQKKRRAKYHSEIRKLLSREEEVKDSVEYTAPETLTVKKWEDEVARKVDGHVKTKGEIFTECVKTGSFLQAAEMKDETLDREQNTLIENTIAEEINLLVKKSKHAKKTEAWKACVKYIATAGIHQSFMLANYEAQKLRFSDNDTEIRFAKENRLSKQIKWDNVGDELVAHVNVVYYAAVVDTHTFVCENGILKHLLDDPVMRDGLRTDLGKATFTQYYSSCPELNVGNMFNADGQLSEHFKACKPVLEISYDIRLTVVEDRAVPVIEKYSLKTCAGIRRVSDAPTPESKEKHQPERKRSHSFH